MRIVRICVSDLLHLELVATLAPEEAHGFAVLLRLLQDLLQDLRQNRDRVEPKRSLEP